MRKDESSARRSPRYDLLIVGAGPAGLAAACTAAQCGLSYLVLERDAALASTVRHYPVGKPLHSPPHDVELLWGELHTSGHRNPSREEVLEHYEATCARLGLNLRLREEVSSIESTSGGFRVRSACAGHESSYSAKRVLLAVGGFGVPRSLDVPGAIPGRVMQRFVDGAPYVGRSVLVVGGGNSAAEAAIFLHEAGARVTLSLRRPSLAPRDGESDLFTSVKAFNRERLEGLAARKELRILYASRVTRIGPDAAYVRLDDDSECRVPCARVFALLGADPDTRLLRSAGAALAVDGRPVYDRETYETTVPGLYVAGHLTRELHMPNALAITPRVVRRIAGESRPPRSCALPLELAALGAKALRRRSELVRLLVRAYPATRRFVQKADAGATLHARRAAVREFLRRHPSLHGFFRTLRRAAA